MARGFAGPRTTDRSARSDRATQRFGVRLSVTLNVKHEGDESSAVPALILDSGPEIAALCRRYEARQSALFGSSLRADFDAAVSDVDIVVEFGPQANHRAYEGAVLSRDGLTIISMSGSG